METLITFGLGAGSVLIILGVGVVFRLVKQIDKLKNFTEYLEDRLKDDFAKFRRELDEEYKRVDDITNNIYSNMDSRLDKLESKIKNEQGSKQIIK
jgi:predicted PurR-regulated permease PerM